MSIKVRLSPPTREIHLAKLNQKRPSSSLGVARYLAVGLAAAFIAACSGNSNGLPEASVPGSTPSEVSEAPEATSTSAAVSTAVPTQSAAATEAGVVSGSSSALAVELSIEELTNAAADVFIGHPMRTPGIAPLGLTEMYICYVAQIDSDS